MIDRKINVEKLSDQQLEKAEKLISETVKKEIDKVVNKWNPVFAKQDLCCKMQVTIQEEDPGFSIADKTVDADVVKGEEARNQILSELDTAISNCNQLLTRYGLICDMVLVTEPLTTQ